MERAQWHHARLIAPLMRPRDILEVMAGTGVGVEEAMGQALRCSLLALTCFADLCPLAMFGVSKLSVLGAAAQVWCFGTRDIERFPYAFARASRRMLPVLQHYAPILTNYVDASDPAALRWLAFLGARYVLPPQLRSGRLFGQFILAADPPKVSTCLPV